MKEIITGILPEEAFPSPPTAAEGSGKTKVILRAPVLTSSGYGVHSRQIARWLFDLEDSGANIEVFCEALKWGNTPWLLNPKTSDGLIGRLIQCSMKRAEKLDVSIQLQLPNEWNPFLADFNIGVTAAVETDRCSPEWVVAVNKMDMVIVPSKFVASVFQTAGPEITTPIHVIPESFPDSCKDENIDKAVVDLSEVTTDFNFLILSQFCGNNPENDRKNMAYTIKWLHEEFKDHPEIGVIIKTNFGRNTKLDRIQTTTNLVKILLETKQGAGPSFYLMHGEMSDSEIAGLYRHPKVNALLSLTRGEGFGLPILEAAACGLPVIVTDWSAHTEFLKAGKYIKVDYKLGEIHESRIDDQIFYAGMKWAYPIEDDAKRKLTRFVRSSSLPNQWAKDLAAKLQVSHNFEAIAEAYDELLGDKIK